MWPCENCDAWEYVKTYEDSYVGGVEADTVQDSPFSGCASRGEKILVDSNGYITCEKCGTYEARKRYKVLVKGGRWRFVEDGFGWKLGFE